MRLTHHRFTNTTTIATAILSGALLLQLSPINAAPICAQRAAAAPALAKLRDVMATGRFVAYQPTSLHVINGVVTPADAASIKRDLEVLKPRFNGLITYSSNNGAEQVADIAAGLGYRAVILGVWDINNTEEINNALAAAKRQSKLVLGISLGNELWLFKKNNPAQLAQAINKLRKQAPRLLLTTTEPFHLFLEPAAAPIMVSSDFMMVNVHPIFQPWFRTAPDAKAAEFVVNVVAKLQPLACGPVLVKETGVPTAPEAMGYTADRQAGFYAALQTRFPPAQDRAFAYFSAFDAPWRATDATPVAGTHPEEAHFGLYDEQRKPKPVITAIPTLK